MLKDNSVTVSLCMITRDEERFLARCLRSVRPVVDEVIVVDTGSRDRTREIAAGFDAKIFDFKWTGDFSETRNFSISKATGRWIFSLDADEAISRSDHSRFRALVHGVTPVPVAYSLITRNYTNDPNQVGWVANDGRYPDEQAGCGWVATEKVRLFPNDRQIRYDYTVHEMVEPAVQRQGLEIKGCRIPIHHYGPLIEDKKLQKMRSYYQLARQKLNSRQDDTVALYEMAIQSAIIGKTAEAIACWKKFIVRKPDMPDAWVHLSTAFFQLQDYRSALQAAKNALALNPEMREAIYNVCLCEFMIGDIGNIIGHLTNLLGRTPEFLPARLMLAAAHICNGNRQLGRRELEDLRSSELGFNISATYRDLAKRLVEQNRSDYAQMLLESVAETGLLTVSSLRRTDALGGSGLA